MNNKTQIASLPRQEQTKAEEKLWQLIHDKKFLNPSLKESENAKNKPIVHSQKNGNYNILSTKKISPIQKDILSKAGLSFFDYDAITISNLAFKVKNDYQNYIFTSQNAVRAILNTDYKLKNCFCVGEKTKLLLESNGLEVTENSKKASFLGEIVAKNYKNESFLFICGNRRREELPAILKENKITFEEVVVYETNLNRKKIDFAPNAILFFSPSGVESYNSENEIGDSIAFCIGDTTAKEAEKHTTNTIIPAKSTIDNLLIEVLKYYRPEGFKQ
ncbi:MAG: uroporphyrinogen-III synthase [Cellulophaga sp.]